MEFFVSFGQNESLRKLFPMHQENLHSVLPFGQKATHVLFRLLASSSPLHNYRDGVRVLPASLVAVTTLSAFGRSSLYNRVSKDFDGRHNSWAVLSLGPCEGWGTFHFSDDLYQRMKKLYRLLYPEKPVNGFGTGPKIRQQIIVRILQDLGLSKKFMRHNIGREVFIIPHIANLQTVLGGSEEVPEYDDQPFAQLAMRWKERYFLPRASTRCSTEGRDSFPRILGLAPRIDQQNTINVQSQYIALASAK